VRAQSLPRSHSLFLARERAQSLSLTHTHTRAWGVFLSLARGRTAPSLPPCARVLPPCFRLSISLSLARAGALTLSDPLSVCLPHSLFNALSLIQYLTSSCLFLRSTMAQACLEEGAAEEQGGSRTGAG
jgi:hypothetical protein